MAEKDKIEDFIKGLYNNPDKQYYSKKEIIAEARKVIKENEGYEWLFEQLPEHDYDRISLQNAIGSLLARRT